MSDDRRARRRPIPDSAMSPAFDIWRREVLGGLIVKLQVALARPATARGALEALEQLEQAIDGLTDYRGMLTAWAIDPDGGELTQEQIAGRVGRAGTTVGDRAKPYVDRARELS